MHLYTSQLLLINRKPKTGDVHFEKKQIRAQTKKRSIKPNLFSCRSLRFRCDTFAIFCTVSGSLGVFKMLVIAANTCFFINVHLVYRWYSQVFNNLSNTTITWTAFWQLIDKDTTWTFQKFIRFSHINCPMSMLSGIATQKYMSKNLSLPTWKFIREERSEKTRTIFTMQTFSEARNQIFSQPRRPRNNSSIQTFKLKNCLFPQHPTENSLFLGHNCH